MSVDLSLPCRVITLNVQLGPASGGTTLEAMVARAIRLRYDTTKGLADFFGLPEPVIGDVVHSLWSRGWLWVDFDTGQIGLSDRAEDADPDPTNDPAVRTERREYLYEPLSRLIFSAREGRRRPHRDHLEVPADVEVGLGLANTDAAELRSAVQRLLVDEQNSSVNSVVLSVLPAGTGEGRDASLRWISVRVGVAYNDVTDRLRIQHVDASNSWPVQAFTRLGNRLADYVERWPKSAFSTALKGRRTVQLERFPSAETLLERFEAALDRRIKPGSSAAWQERHKSLTTTATALHQYLDGLARRRSHLELLTDGPARLAALREILATARHQVVVVAGDLGPTSLQTLARNGVDHALKGGAQLVLVWGRGGGDELGASADAQVKAWQHLYPHQVLVPKTSARTAASMVLVDDRFAVVGAGEPTGVDGAGLAAVWLSPLDPGPLAEPSQAVLDLLVWARNHCPDLLVSQAILTPTELAGRTAAAAPTERVPQFPPLPDDADPALLRIWHDSWAEYRDMLAAAVRALPDGQPVVEVLLDGEIDEIIAERVRHAGRRLAVADDRTARQSVRNQLVAEIADRADSGLVVQVDCPRPPVANPALERLPHQPRTGPPRGRVVLADDQVILGSAPPLSARYAARLSQVAIRAHHRKLADDVADWLGVAPSEEPGGAAATTSSFLGARHALIVAQAARLAQQQGEPLDQHLRRAFDGFDDPWSVLALLDQPDVDSSVLAVAVAVVLRRPDPPAEQRARWGGWLVRHLWEQRAFVAAAVVSDLLPDLPGALPAAACVLAAAIEHPAPGLDQATPIQDLDGRAAADPHTDAAKAVGAAGLLAGYLLGGDSGPAEYFPWVAKALPPTWQEMLDQAWSLYGRIEWPVPVGHVPVREAERAVAEDRWQAVADRTEHLISLRNRFRFQSGADLYSQLTSERGILTRLLRAAQGGDRQLRSSVAAELPKRAQVHFDDLVAAAGGEKIAWAKHRSWLDRVDEVFRLCRAAAAADTEPADSSGSTLVRPADLDFARWLRAKWGDLTCEAAEVVAPYHLPLEALLRRLRPLTTWGGDQL